MHVPTSTKDPLQADAPALLLRTVRTLNAHYQPAQDQELLLQICETLGGLPLGIKMAAPLLLDPKGRKILEDLPQRVHQLQAGQHLQGNKHTSLTEIFHQAQELLPAEARQLLEEFGLFAESATPEACTSILQSQTSAASTLLHHSLLSFDGQRYRMHRVLHRLAQSKLLHAPTYQEKRQRHAAYYLRYIEPLEGASADKEKEREAQIAQALDNIRVAWGFLP